ncbi:MAG: TonB-dependent receptor [Cyclobacteriaceae bacterium]
MLKLPASKLTVEKLLKDVLPEHDVTISYNDDIIPFKKIIKFKRKSASLLSVLNRICHNSHLSWLESGGQILFLFYQRPESEFYYTISGKILEQGTNEPLIGAHLLSEGSQKGSVSNAYGFYSLTLPGGEHTLNVNFVGHQKIQQPIMLKGNVVYNFHLQPKSTELSDVTITSKSELDLAYQNTLMGASRLNMEFVGDIPYFMGEVDVFQSSLLLPGITNVGEGTSGVNVRGGSADQNMIMLDEALIYNSHHFFGLTSVFNPDAVSDVEIYKGSFPVSYGGRLSSVMHIRQRDGNNEKFHASGGVGLITSRLLLEGPITKNKHSFLVSGRTTFWDFLTRGAENPTIKNTRANFRDFNAKINFQLNDRNKLYLSSYTGQDENRFGLDVLRKWGNTLFSVRWNKIYNVKLFSNTTTYLSSYRYRVIEEDDKASFVGTSRITDYAFKTDFTYFRNPEHIYNFGGSFTYHRLTPGKRIPGISSTNNEIDLGNENALESSLYFSNEFKLNNKLTLTSGLRLTHFSKVGPGDVFIYSNNRPRDVGAIVDTVSYSNGKGIRTFANLHPRATLKYQLNPSSALKVNYSNTVQYMHRLSNTITPSSSDIWKASDNYLEPSKSDQITFGYYKFFTARKLDASLELFYRKNRNIIEYKGGADLLFNPAIETELLFGNTRAYGVELLLKKDLGSLTGWLGYTLSKSEIQVNGLFEDEKINEGEYFPTDFNRTHDLSLSAIYQINRKWSLSSNFVYQTGRPFSFPVGKYEFDGFVVPHYEERNRHRLPDYHRLDIAARMEGRLKRRNGKDRKNKSFWVFSIYNMYSRRNTQAYLFQESEESPGETEVTRFSMLGVLVPSVTYNFKF